ncbi:MAG TPA: hypothetical protein VHZ30_02980 [Verrucomicrobiae bacterium]|jgi:hypothetical protein|nr:hypothetical protein [Verrucomicrobiae bacterium]
MAKALFDESLIETAARGSASATMQTRDEPIANAADDQPEAVADDQPESDQDRLRDMAAKGINKPIAGGKNAKAIAAAVSGDSDVKTKLNRLGAVLLPNSEAPLPDGES